jgi:hypothetical protein
VPTTASMHVMVTGTGIAMSNMNKSFKTTNATLYGQNPATIMVVWSIDNLHPYYASLGYERSALILSVVLLFCYKALNMHTKLKCVPLIVSADRPY